MTLKGKTLFITGAAAASAWRSACARRATAPTSRSPPRPIEPHPKLPGTIHTAAAEIEEAGGKALAMHVRHPRRRPRSRAAVASSAPSTSAASTSW